MPRGVYIRSPAYRAKMAVATRNRVLSDEAKTNIRAAALISVQKMIAANRLNPPNLGRSMSDAQKLKLHLAFKGKRPATSPEIRKKISDALRGRSNPLVHGSRSPLWKHGLSTTREYIKNMKQRRYAFERGGGPLSTKTVQMIYEDNIKQYGTLTCIYCLRSIQFGQDTLEHKQPLSRGGKNDYENLAVACVQCNSRKRAMLYNEFMQMRQGIPLAAE